MDMDVIIFLILALVVIFCLTVFMVLSYSGFFVEPQVHTGEPPWSKQATTIAYKYYTGPYNANDIGATFTEVTSIAPTAFCLGIFYDDPHVVAPERLRSVVACIVKENESEKDEKALVDEKTLKLFEEKEFSFHKLPAVDLTVNSEFPYTTPFSIWLAPNRVYPRIADYISSRGLCAYPMIELYKDCKILYAAPLSKQEDFFVRESLKEADSEENNEAKSTATNLTPVDVDTDESPNLRTSSRNVILGALPADNIVRDPSVVSNVSCARDEELINEEGSCRTSRSGSKSSSFEEIGNEDVSPIVDLASKKTN